MENLPDLSHLNPDERTLLEQVFLRQRKEEEWDTEIMRCAFLPSPPAPQTSSQLILSSQKTRLTQPSLRCIATRCDDAPHAALCRQARQGTLCAARRNQ